jgi:DNA ligase-1
VNIVKESPVLQSVTRTGKKKFWQAQIVYVDDFVFTNRNECADGAFCVRTKYWQEGPNGASLDQYSEPKVAWPTNVGRTNERNNEQQAYFELDALIKKQNDKGYFGEGVEKQLLPTPMLANKWHDKKHLIKFPVFVQPKLDGVRMLMQDGKCWSRMGKEFIPEVVKHIAMNTNGMILDGELILTGATFQDTIRAVKKYRPEESPKLTYHVFDIIEDFSFWRRFEKLSRFIHVSSAVKLVPTDWVPNEELMMGMHSSYIAQGYEGTIIRVINGKYQIGQRSSELLKLKDFDDAEFTIVGVEEGEGRDSGAAIFVCITDQGNTFSVRPKGTIEGRQAIYITQDSFIGKPLTVRYQGFSEDGIPRFPVGLSVRDREIQG